MTDPATSDPTSSAPAVRPALLTGFGLGAFLDGIVLHQVLQWHHLVELRQPVEDVGTLRDNVTWDGAFHLVSWVLVLAGLLWLSHRGDAARALGRRRLCGLLLAGWGAFTLVDQVLLHLLLRAHTVRIDGDRLLYETGYTALGVVLVLAGWRLARR
jgi:uncharacterized membrane protein